MLRTLYSLLLRLHPERFRKRFAQEMLSIFDQVEKRACRREACSGRAALARAAVDAALGILGKHAGTGSLVCGRRASFLHPGKF